jgi:hypothetical protein
MKILVIASLAVFFFSSPIIAEAQKSSVSDFSPRFDPSRPSESIESRPPASRESKPRGDIKIESGSITGPLNKDGSLRGGAESRSIEPSRENTKGETGGSIILRKAIK